MKKIILASQSPRRRELLTQAGIDFQVITSQVEEKITKKEPDEIAKDLSSQKAWDVFNRILEEQGEVAARDILVIGADTVVALDGTILGKPRDRQEAFSMLKSLQGRSHQVFTGVTVVGMGLEGMEAHTFSECTQVEFYPVSDEELHAYIATGDCDDKAGSYGIQGPFAVHVKGIQGDYNNVVGLPIARLYQELKSIGELQE